MGTAEMEISHTAPAHEENHEPPEERKSVIIQSQSPIHHAPATSMTDTKSATPPPNDHLKTKKQNHLSTKSSIDSLKSVSTTVTSPTRDLTAGPSKDATASSTSHPTVDPRPVTPIEKSNTNVDHEAEKSEAAIHIKVEQVEPKTETAKEVTYSDQEAGDNVGNVSTDASATHNAIADSEPKRAREPPSSPIGPPHETKRASSPEDATSLPTETTTDPPKSASSDFGSVPKESVPPANPVTRIQSTQTSSFSSGITAKEVRAHQASLSDDEALETPRYWEPAAAPIDFDWWVLIVRPSRLFVEKGELIVRLNPLKPRTRDGVPLLSNGDDLKLGTIHGPWRILPDTNYRCIHTGHMVTKFNKQGKPKKTHIFYTGWLVERTNRSQFAVIKVLMAEHDFVENERAFRAFDFAVQEENADAGVTDWEIVFDSASVNHHFGIGTLYKAYNAKGELGVIAHLTKDWDLFKLADGETTDAANYQTL